MNSFKNLNISKKIVVGFMIIALLSGVIGLNGMLGINKLEGNNEEFYNNIVIPLEEMALISTMFQEIRVSTRQILLLSNQADKKREVEKINELKEEINILSADFEASIIHDEDEKIFDEYTTYIEDFEKELDIVLNTALAGNTAKAWELIQADSQAGKLFAGIESSIEALLNGKIEDGDAQRELNKNIKAVLVTVQMVLLAGVILLSIILAKVISGVIAKPIKSLTIASKQLAIGDMNIKIDYESKDEVGVLSKNLMEMAKNIKEQGVIAERIANGEDGIVIELRSEHDMVGKGLKDIIDTNRAILEGIEEVANEISENGKLGKKIRTNNLNGTWKKIAADINNLTESIEKPMMYAANWIGQLASGEMVEEVEFEGYKGDVRGMLENLSMLRTTVNYLYFEVVKLNEEQKKGNLNHRIDISGINGGFQHILVMINEGVDAIIDPVVDASEVLNKMAHGELSARVSGEYNGDYAQMKNSLNSMGEIIQSYIKETGEVLSEVGNKNLNVEISREYVGDFKGLKDSINNILSQFNVIFDEIFSAAEQVESATIQVSDSSQELSSGSVEQSSAVEQISASITQVAEQIGTNAENSKNANEISFKAKGDAESGNKQMHELLEAMGSIKESSKNISTIIKVIDDIAFQTNILALNAAVEAARAGEHGRGFAVVAEEVRNLAARSAAAANETTDLINNSIEQVDHGNIIAKNTADALEKIVEGITNAVDLVGSIAEASSEQSQAIAHVNEGIDQVSQVTQANSATSEESAAASEEMASQARMLKTMISDFELKNRKAQKHVKIEAKKIEKSNKKEIIKKENPMKFEVESKEKKSEKVVEQPISIDLDFMSGDNALEISLDDTDFGKY